MTVNKESGSSHHLDLMTTAQDKVISHRMPVHSRSTGHVTSGESNSDHQAETTEKDAQDVEFHVFTSLHHTIILGLDFLQSNHVKIDLSNRTVHLHDGLISVSLVDANAGFARPRKTVQIPPHSQADIPVKISRCESNRVLLLEPFPGLETLQLQGAKCLIQSAKGRPCMRFLNPTDKPVTLRCQRIVATASIIDPSSVHTLESERILDHPSVNTAVPSSPSKLSANLNFDLSDSDLTETQKQQLECFLLSQRSVFARELSELGTTHLHQHKIETEHTRPVRLPFYRQSSLVRKECARQIKEMLDAGIIEPSHSEWHSPVVMVKKSDNSYRFAVDYRKLNAVTKPIFFPLPRLEDVIDAIGEKHAQMFSVLDCASGFWQIPLHPETKHKSAFITQDGIFEFNRLPFGLKNAPAAFQQTICSALQAMNWKHILIYVDDMIIYSRTFEEHLHHLKCVFGKLKEAGLTLKPSKCRFAAKRVTYLGHVFSKDGVEVDKSKVEVVKSIPSPKNVHDIRHFLGLASYYRKFVPNFSRIASPLYNLLQKDATFNWSDECEQALNKLKGCLTSAPVLTYPDPNKPFILTTDASTSAIGYILGQRDASGQEHVICYGGRALHAAEKKWGITQLECLAVLEGIRTFRVYLTSQKFKVFTDHHALKWLKDIKQETGRLARWSLMLQEYDYEIEHRAGKANTNADALSRIPYPAQIIEPVTDDFPVPPVPSINYTSATIQSNHHPIQHSYAEAVSTPPTNPSATTNHQIASQLTAADNDYGISPECSTSENLHLSGQKAIAPSSASSIDLYVEFCYQDEIPSGPTVQTIGTDIPENNLAERQRSSPDFKPIIDFLENGEIPSHYNDSQVKGLQGLSQEYDLCEGILYHFYLPKHRGHKNGRHPMVTQLAVPISDRKSLLYAYHDSKAGGCHFGRDATRQSILTKYHWPGLYQDVETYIKSCEECQKSKRWAHSKPAPMVPMPIEDNFSRLHVDILGPLPQTKDGHKYVLVAVDSFSRWIEAFPLHTQDAVEVATKLFNEVFTRYGAPRTLVTDRGRQFTSKLVNAICEIFEVKHHFTSSYHPQTNGMVERRNSTIAQALKSYCKPDQSNWADILPCVLMSMRNTPCQSTGYSPHHMLFGREMCLPFDTTLTPKPTLGKNAETHLQQLIDNLKVVKSIARDNMSVSQQIDKEHQELKSSEPSFMLGQQVLLHSPVIKQGLSPKLSQSWTGPYYITDIGPNHTFKIHRCSDDKEHKSLVHANRLKPYVLRGNVARHVDASGSSAPTLVSSRAQEPLPDPPAQTFQGSPPLESPASSEKPTAKADETVPSEHNHKQTKDHNQDQFYDVEKLLKYKDINGICHFLVKWVAHPTPTWEPHHNIGQGLIRDFHVHKTQAGRSRKHKRSHKYFV
ncbi:uncharacterized protein LOC125380443 [Haliotis rufescens]|uniref:uncharacterized protein LOC125380443 n=1 Tax=Haliotis rufescens TaxID=6454 RepID=UPI00201EE3F0|nr:uncharacterized protein LOC125380443 [Haliotis rufescens]